MDSERLPEFFYEIFDASLPRLGPGDEASTLKALDILRSGGPQRRDQSAARTARILDLGCGNGAQTIVLASHTEGLIVAMDNHQPYLDELQRRAATAGSRVPRPTPAQGPPAAPLPAGGDITRKAIAAIILGGTSIYGGAGAIWRSLVGVYLLALIQNGFNILNANPFFIPLTTGLIIVAAVALGAGAVLVGRAYLYGLMAGGDRGAVVWCDPVDPDSLRPFVVLDLAKDPPRTSFPRSVLGARGDGRGASACRRDMSWRHSALCRRGRRAIRSGVRRLIGRWAGSIRCSGRHSCSSTWTKPSPF